MGIVVETLTTVPWDRSSGFTRELNHAPVGGFMLTDQTQSPLPHLFAVRSGHVYVVNLAGAAPLIDSQVVLLVAGAPEHSVAAHELDAEPFIGKTIDDLLILADGSVVWTLHDDDAEHFLVRSSAVGDTIWSTKIGRVEHHAGEGLDALPLADRLLTVTYHAGKIAFRTLRSSTGETVETWLEPRAVDRFHQVEGGELVGIGFSEEERARKLVGYDCTTRRTAVTPLDQEHYGLFGGLIGADRRSRLYLALGSRLARYSPDGRLSEIDVRRDVAPSLQAPVLPPSEWRVDPDGQVLLADPGEQGLSIMGVRFDR